MIKFFKRGFGHIGYAVSMLPEDWTHRYLLVREHAFFWIVNKEMIEIFTTKEDLDKKIKYMNITPRNYENI